MFVQLRHFWRSSLVVPAGPPLKLAPAEGGLIFHAAPETIAGLKLAGVSIVSTANNHARDCGSHGVEFTVSWLRSHSIEPLESSESPSATHKGVVLTRKGVRFGFLGFTFDQQNGNWRDIDERIALTDIQVLSRDLWLCRLIREREACSL